ncbi:MAG: bifunctional demethylmenaquinone methyltransferase/2-methoxy-6-polyprenyl-1,4-benzoquinol methylase UbiE [Bacteroidota bacterium]|nr:bifunctional demethylmenaquinone methyltransferase/2-methoxy-6-polyprenyl-1,4-benzoquinol methylase UbiE [Candidatus Kapabacteria bacterium]MDW8219682.1 bifunctional demethylmenaquinone methyltransferase/2-methoxy-6-polyprenyl-1,4-benzoquinol methylase UbiE [Bacteroidota bacterium]
MSEAVRTMFARIAPRYDVGNNVLSFGIHHYWRQAVVRYVGAQPGMSVLDCATGTGDLAIAFKRAVGSTGTVIGTDFCAEMMQTAPSKARKSGLDIRFEIADAMCLPYANNTFDIASIAFGIRNVDEPMQALREMARVVRPGGKVVVLEFGQPSGVVGILFRAYSEYILSWIGGLISGYPEAYSYLHHTASVFPSGKAFDAMMNQTAAFTTTSYTALTFGIAYIYVGVVA